MEKHDIERKMIEAATMAYHDENLPLGASRMTAALIAAERIREEHYLTLPRSIEPEMLHALSEHDHRAHKTYCVGRRTTLFVKWRTTPTYGKNL